ncbi:MAG TPA: tetratricopeptide repeat protein [Novosphingobium sp.]|nr:tetratricopeptide repeat protein [Novosphingobium sp.]
MAGKIGFACALALLGVSGTALQAQPYTSEIGYPDGALGLAAIQHGDLSKAEAQLNSLQGVEANDPARLINLGQVYARTGRYKEAKQAYIAALNSRESFDVLLTDGRTMSSRDAARLALMELRGKYAAR